MTDNINPSHYKDGPFECIELSRLLSSDWGQAVQYCFRWQHKNGVEDLKKAFWFINDAITHNVPFFAACCKRNADILEAQAIRLLSILQAENWADLEQLWRNLKWGDRVDVLEALTEKINEMCVDTTPIIGDSRVSYSSNVSSEHASVYELIGLMESTKADFLQ